MQLDICFGLCILVGGLQYGYNLYNSSAVHKKCLKVFFIDPSLARCCHEEASEAETKAIGDLPYFGPQPSPKLVDAA